MNKSCKKNQVLEEDDRAPSTGSRCHIDRKSTPPPSYSWSDDDLIVSSSLRKLFLSETMVAWHGMESSYPILSKACPLSRLEFGFLLNTNSISIPMIFPWISKSSCIKISANHNFLYSLCFDQWTMFLSSCISIQAKGTFYTICCSILFEWNWLLENRVLVLSLIEDMHTHP